MKQTSGSNVCGIVKNNRLLHLAVTNDVVTYFIYGTGLETNENNWRN